MTKFKRILSSILSIVTTMCISVDFIYGKGSFEGNDYRWVIILFGLYILISKAFEIYNRRLFKYSIIFGGIISLCATVGFTAERYLIENLTISYKEIIILLSQFEAIFVCITTLTVFLLNSLPKIFDKIKLKKEFILFTANKKSIFFIAIVLFLAYLPYILHYYPGNVLIDSTVQIMQGQGDAEFTTHHPPIHTALITVCINLGHMLTGSYNFGAFIYTMVQTVATCFIFSYTIFYMAKKKVPKSIRLFSTLFYAFCPTISFMTITMYKDIPFALALLALTICITEIATNLEIFIKNRVMIFLTIIAVFLVAIFRNNGLYAVVISTPIIMLCIKKHKIKVGAIFITGIALCVFVTGPVYNMCKIGKGSSKEAFSVILQQYARITKYKEDELTDQEKSAIYKYLPVDNIAELYNPVFSDPVKHQFSDQAFKEDKVTLFKTYFQLAIKYPIHTISSLICNSFGYYYPNTLGWGIYYGVNEECFINNGVDYGIKRQPIVNIPILDKINYFVNYKNIPILSMFTNIGFLFWFVVFGLVYCLYTNKKKIIVMYIPVLCMWFTILASPVFGEPRYVYGLFTCMPLLIGMSFRKELEE